MSTKKSAASSSDTTSRRLPPERPGQPGGKRDLNRRKRIEQLREAGLKLFLERGVDQITIDDIAHAAGTAKGNFYRYFNDKADLVQGIIEPFSERVLDSFDACEQQLAEASDDASLAAAYQGLGMALIPVTIELPDVARLYLQESRAPAAGARAPIRAFADKVRERSIHLTEVAVDRKLLRIPDPRISALAVVGSVEQLGWAVLSGHLDAPPHQIAGTLISLVLSGIRG